MKVVALIPARKTSRRLPGKNRRMVGNLALWEHAYFHAYGSGRCDVIAVSTDDAEIVNRRGFEFIRIIQPHFPQSYNVMLDVVKHADDILRQVGHFADVICILQPTSPLRTAADVTACIDMLESPAIDAVVSVTDGEDDVIFRMGHAGRLEKLIFPDGRRVRPNGAIYAIKTNLLRAGGSWYGEFSYGYLMPKERSIDIDNEVDLEMAEIAWSRHHAAA